MKNIYPELELEKILDQRLKSLKYFEPIDLVFNRDPRFGDLSTPVALRIGKARHMDPINVAEEIIRGLKWPRYVCDISISKPGYINFKLNTEFYLSALARPYKLPLKRYCAKQNILIEYSSPNIAKPFGVGHLRSTIIGDAVANLYAALEYKVTRVNHLGDWGTQFGKLIYAYKKWGDAEIVEQNPLPEMLRLYVRFHGEAELNPSFEGKARYWFKKLEDGDEEAQTIWRKFTGWSLTEFKRIYDLLGVKFDETKGESSYISSAKVIVDELKRKRLATGSEGALVVKFTNENITTALLMKNDGATLYLTRDLAALKYRLQSKKADVVIYHVGSEQTLHFQQLFDIARRAGWAQEDQLIYAPHGLMRLPEGKMSTRLGKIVELDKVLDEAVARAYKIVDSKNHNLPKAQKDKIAKAVGIGAVKYNDLKNQRATNITFDWDQMLSLQGNSAPYLQYTYARLKSIARNANTRAKVGRELNDDELAIAQKIVTFPSVIAAAAYNQSPNLLATYLHELAGQMSEYYEKYPVIKAEPATRRHRLAVILSAASVLKSGLTLLGLQSPEEI